MFKQSNFRPWVKPRRSHETAVLWTRLSELHQVQKGPAKGEISDTSPGFPSIIVATCGCESPGGYLWMLVRMWRNPQDRSLVTGFDELLFIPVFFFGGGNEQLEAQTNHGTCTIWCIKGSWKWFPTSMWLPCRRRTPRNPMPKRKVLGLSTDPQNWSGCLTDVDVAGIRCSRVIASCSQLNHHLDWRNPPCSAKKSRVSLPKSPSLTLHSPFP